MQGLEQEYHYKVIARAIEVIDAEGPGLRLEDLAARMGMSAAHFQRVFSAWVGVSPKRYQQYLALGLAREMLERRASVLEAADAAGLSGGGRLHDLFVTWEAMTPGEVARGGAGLEIFWSRVDTPFGPAIAMATQRGLCGLGFIVAGEAAAFEDLRARWPGARYRQDPARVGPLVEGLKERRAGALHLIGAPFQIKVWDALLRVPEGHVTTYSELARAVGHPKAVRAVGTAVGRNPVSWFIPCHRALRKSGALGGYHWGLPVKRSLLAWEAARSGF
jgi:AraC family transcriptional regulator of adaptative response/methylated-DNA-[protein]-cysteine methyltransferase